MSEATKFEFTPQCVAIPDEQMCSSGPEIDSSTNLLNYKSFQDVVEARLKNLPEDSSVGLLWIDLTNLRKIFSLRGWKGVDAVMERVVCALRANLDGSALMGKFSARCLVAAIPHPRSDRRLRKRLCMMLSELKGVNTRDAYIAIQIAAGIAFYPSDAQTAEDLVRFASLAATQAAESKDCKIIAFNTTMNSLIQSDNQLEEEMHQGFDQDQFYLAYQPKVDLLTGSLLGVEALIRWNHPTRGIVAPGEFIPLAERSELIWRIFDFSLRSSLSDARHWQELGGVVPVISVNASPENVKRGDFAQVVRRILREYPIEPTKLELEITESVLFDDEQLFVTRMRQLRDIGVRIAIDDFGTRYTGFNVLKRVTFDVIKIDQCFIRDIDKSKDMQAMCGTIVAMARQLGMGTVAEGIETRRELESLRQAGCEAGQGYLFQRPVREPDFWNLLCEWPEKRFRFGLEGAVGAGR